MPSFHLGVWGSAIAPQAVALGSWPHSCSAVVAWIYKHSRDTSDRHRRFPARWSARRADCHGDAGHRHNVAQAFSLVGALSIVRFTVVRDTEHGVRHLRGRIGMGVGAGPVGGGIGLVVVGGASWIMRLPRSLNPHLRSTLTLRVPWASTRRCLGALDSQVLATPPVDWHDARARPLM
jgi:hypothetical protein